MKATQVNNAFYLKLVRSLKINYYVPKNIKIENFQNYFNTNKKHQTKSLMAQW